MWKVQRKSICTQDHLNNSGGFGFQNNLLIFLQRWSPFEEDKRSRDSKSLYLRIRITFQHRQNNLKWHLRCVLMRRSCWRRALIEMTKTQKSQKLHISVDVAAFYQDQKEPEQLNVSLIPLWADPHGASLTLPLHLLESLNDKSICFIINVSQQLLLSTRVAACSIRLHRTLLCGGDPHSNYFLICIHLLPTRS